MSVPLRVGILVLVLVALIAPTAYGLATAQVSATAQVPARLEPGKKLYRKFCGQCHALKEARAVGLGIGRTGSTDKGEADMAGPSFNELRVTAHQSKLAILGVWDGHSRVMTLMTHADINMVSNYIQAATKDHKYKATLPSDFFR